MARNKDGSVTLKTTGKLASTPKKGSGVGRKAPLAQSSGGDGPKVRKDKREVARKSVR